MTQGIRQLQTGAGPRTARRVRDPVKAPRHRCASCRCPLEREYAKRNSDCLLCMRARDPQAMPVGPTIGERAWDDET